MYRDPVGQLVAASHMVFNGCFCVRKRGPQRIVKKVQPGDATYLVNMNYRVGGVKVEIFGAALGRTPSLECTTQGLNVLFSADCSNPPSPAVMRTSAESSKQSIH